MSAAKSLSAEVLKVARIFVVIFALLMVYAVTPSPAHAAALTEAQRQAVVNLLSTFGADQGTLDNVGLALRGASREELLKIMSHSSSSVNVHDNDGENKIKNDKGEFPGASACGFLMRSLHRGDSGGDVSQLQSLLKNTGDFANGSTTGFFGPATERALGEWQMRMGLVSSSSASTTGAGMLGPRTREALMMHCKDLLDRKQLSVGSTTPFASDITTQPTCVLKASRSSIKPGESVVLIWESKNATAASTMSGEKGPPRGSINLTPTETVTYLKHVYSPIGEGQCTTTVNVENTTPAAQPKVVIVPTTLDIGRTLSLMGSGMAAVMDGYLSLFGMSLE